MPIKMMTRGKWRQYRDVNKLKLTAKHECLNRIIYFKLIVNKSHGSCCEVSANDR